MQLIYIKINKNNPENGVTSFTYKILIKSSAPGAIIEYFKIRSVVSLESFVHICLRDSKHTVAAHKYATRDL